MFGIDYENGTLSTLKAGFLNFDGLGIRFFGNINIQFSEQLIIYTLVNTILIYRRIILVTILVTILLFSFYSDSWYLIFVTRRSQKSQCVKTPRLEKTIRGLYKCLLYARISVVTSITCTQSNLRLSFN